VLSALLPSQSYLYIFTFYSYGEDILYDALEQKLGQFFSSSIPRLEQLQPFLVLEPWYQSQSPPTIS